MDPEPPLDVPEVDITADEREAMALEGEVPLTYVPAFAALQVARPANVSPARWRQAINDAGMFLDRWGAKAERLGWTEREVIGPSYGATSLVWALAGVCVVELGTDLAVLSDGRVHQRRLQSQRKS